MSERILGLVMLYVFVATGLALYFSGPFGNWLNKQREKKIWVTSVAFSVLMTLVVDALAMVYVFVCAVLLVTNGGL